MTHTVKTNAHVIIMDVVFVVTAEQEDVVAADEVGCCCY